jgi:S1-C subfamily serine protease
MSAAEIKAPVVKVGVRKSVEVDGKTIVGFGSGTGFFVSKSGLIVTAAHVIENTDQIKIHIKGRRKPVDAYLLLADYRADIAVLKVFGIEVPAVFSFCPLDFTRRGLTAIGWRGYGIEWTRGQLLSTPAGGLWIGSVIVGPGFSGGPIYDERARCVVGVTSMSNMRSDKPLALFVRVEASPMVLKLLKKLAPESVEGL